jgi:hypothetical protein
MGSNPAIYWMDVSNKASYYIEQKKNKGSQIGHTKKKYLKQKKLTYFEGKKHIFETERFYKIKNNINDNNHYKFSYRY